MTNAYYNNVKTFLAGTRARGESVDDDLDGVAVGFDLIATDVNRSLKLASSTADQVLTASVSARKGMYLVFDANGTISIASGTGADAGLRADLASSVNLFGASLIGVEDSAGNFTATTVETALAEIIADLAAATAGNGASLIGVEDSAGNFTATTVEAALAEIITGAQTITGLKTFTNDLIIEGGEPTIKFLDTTAAADAFFLYVNSNTFHLLSDRNADGISEIPNPLQLQNSNSLGYIYGKEVYTATGTDVAVADGGTGASTAAAARTNLGAAGLADANTFTAMQTWSKGADLTTADVVAGVLTLGSDGNTFNFTGTDTITSIAGAAVGTTFKINFDAAANLTNHATDLILLGGADITTAAGDWAEFFVYAVGDVKMTNYQRNYPVVAGFLRSGDIYTREGDAVAISMETIATSVWHSYGPTGSGATRIDTGLDIIPLNAKWIDVRIEGNLDVGNTGIITLNLYKRPYGTAFAASALNNVYKISFDTASTIAGLKIGSITAGIKIPLDGSNRFERYWTYSLGGGTFNTMFLNMYIEGFGV